MATATLSFFRTLAVQTVKPHVPLIKFRKGGLSDGGHHSSTKTVTPASASSPPPTSSSSKAKVISKPILEDYQLPLKYRRQPLDQAEIDAINSGGC